MQVNTRLALTLSYLGGGFAGWQRQVKARTVQGELEAALARLYGGPMTVHGAGRTDAGVHAAGQVAHVDVPAHIGPAGVMAALNTLLPADLRVMAVRRVPPSFHARDSASAKCYCYHLAWGAPLPPWEGQRRLVVPRPPNLALMRSCLETAIGTHNFAAFALSGHSGHGLRGTTRTITRAVIRARGRRADIVVEGDGFLRGMVRRLVGALLEVGRGARERSSFEALVSAVPATRPAPTAPAHGLVLQRVTYPAAARTLRARLSRS